MLYAHPKVHPDPARIRFLGFGAYSLDLEIFAYVRVTDYGEFLAVQEDVYLRIMDIVAASGTGFAFPSQTTYFARDTGLDPARRRAGEAEVRAGRERRELYLPEFPPGRVAALHATLDYPPAGAPPRSDGAAPGGGPPWTGSARARPCARPRAAPGAGALHRAPPPPAAARRAGARPGAGRGVPLLPRQRGQHAARPAAPARPRRERLGGAGGPGPSRGGQPTARARPRGGR